MSMPTSNILWAVSGGSAFALGIAATIIWAVWIAPYVEQHAQRAASFLFTLAALRDYRTATKVATRLGERPWFVSWFGRLMVAALLFFLGAVAISVLT